MSFRRFLYLAADDCAERTNSLRRIDMSRLFFRPSTSSEAAEQQQQPTPLDASGGAGADLPGTKDGGFLPAPTIHVRHPRVKQMRHSIDLVLFEDKVDWRQNKVVAMDNLGRALMCYPEADELPAAVVTALPSMASSKFAPFAVAVGGSLYVMDEYPERPNACQYSFEVLASDDDHRLFNKCEEWRWHPLAPPPSVYYGPRDDPSVSVVESHAVVAGAHIVVSNRSAKRTFSFDTVARKWSTAGHWALPFTGAAAYVPEHRLWFGISSLDDGHCFCAADLVDVSPGSDETMRPPELHGFWKEYVEPPPPEWCLERSYAVHLGSCKFCIVRFFEVASAIHVCPATNEHHRLCPGLQAVFTGVEVDNPGGDQLRVLRHKSERYKLDETVDYRVV